jgi:cytochrome c oxidase subunit 4
MTEHRWLTPFTYTAICVVLVLLTVLTLGVSFIPLEGAWHIVAGLVIGLCKASLVVLFFMHALGSSRLTWVVIAAACFWLGLLVVLTLSDYFSRGEIPFMPGH